MFENILLMQGTGENNAWGRFIVHILNQILLLEGRIKECDGGNCCGIDKERMDRKMYPVICLVDVFLEHNIETDCTGI
jgi:hypothetical protein